MVTLPLVIAIAAVLVVLAVAILKNVSMSSDKKNVIATVVSAIAGAVGAYVEAGSLEALTGGGVLATVLLVYGASQLIYKFITKPSGIDETIETKING